MSKGTITGRHYMDRPNAVEASSGYMIGIASRGRSHLLKEGKGVWRYIDAHMFGHTSLVVRWSEKEAYSLGPEIPPYVVDDNAGIADKRQYLLETAQAEGVRYLFMMDDDIKLAKRRTDDKRKFAPMETPADLQEVMEACMKVCNSTFPIVHPRIRFHADQAKYRYEKNCPAIRFVCYHVPTFTMEGIRCDGLGEKFMFDRYVQHSLLSRGYKSIALGQYCVDESGSKKGGCYETRNALDQSRSAVALHKAFPMAVKLKKKSNGVLNEERIDCIQYFKKYLEKDESTFIPKSIMEAE